MDFNDYSKYIDITSGEQIIKLDINNIEFSRQHIDGLIGNWSNSSRRRKNIKYSFDKYINENINMYKRLGR